MTFSSSMENGVLSFPSHTIAHMQYYYWISFFIVSIVLKVRDVSIITFIGSHGAEQMNSWWTSDVALGGVHALSKFLLLWFIKDDCKFGN